MGILNYILFLRDFLNSKANPTRWQPSFCLYFLPAKIYAYTTSATFLYKGFLTLHMGIFNYILILKDSLSSEIGLKCGQPSFCLYFHPTTFYPTHQAHVFSANSSGFCISKASTTHYLNDPLTSKADLIANNIPRCVFPAHEDLLIYNKLPSPLQRILGSVTVGSCELQGGYDTWKSSICLYFHPAMTYAYITSFRLLCKWL